ncbi:sugar phosphate nucleotidyltransferase [Streptomyces hirsutus]
MGVYGLSRSTLEDYTPGLPLGFDELVLDLLTARRPPHAYEFDGYWLDIGRPDDYDRANAEFTTRKSMLLKGA